MVVGVLLRGSGAIQIQLHLHCGFCPRLAESLAAFSDFLASDGNFSRV